MTTIAPPTPLERRLLEALSRGPVPWNEAERLVLNMNPGPVIAGLRYRYNLSIHSKRLPAGGSVYHWAYHVLPRDLCFVARILTAKGTEGTS